MNAGFKARTKLLLAGLAVLDIVLSGACLFFADLWFKLFHGAPYVDPQALLRIGAVWATFAILQLIPLVRWQKFPHWLVLIAGVRLTEVVCDWAYLLFCSNVVWFGRVALFLSPPANLAFAWILLRTWARVASGIPEPRHEVSKLG